MEGKSDFGSIGFGAVLLEVFISASIDGTKSPKLTVVASVSNRGVLSGSRSNRLLQRKIPHSMRHVNTILTSVPSSMVSK